METKIGLQAADQFWLLTHMFSLQLSLTLEGLKNSLIVVFAKMVYCSTAPRGAALPLNVLYII